MKVLMTARQPGGGIRTFFRYIYGQECFSDIEFHLIAPDDELGEFFSSVLPQKRIHLHGIPHSNQALFEKTISAIRRGKYDLIHSHGFSAGILTELANTGRTTPHLMTAHDVFRPEQFRGWKGRGKRLVMGRLFRSIEAIHTVTAEAGENLLEFFPGVRPKRVHNILHGVDTDFFYRGQPRPLHQELRLEPEVPLIGFFGRFMAQKGFRNLVDAMALLVADPGVKVKPRVLTFGWGGFIREDYAYVKQLGLESYFIQCPKTDDMPGSLKGVDVVAMPSRWEACGLLAMEALAAGVPIVGTNCVGLNEVLRNTPATIVPVGDPAKLASGLAQTLAPHRREEFTDFQPEACARFDIQRPASRLRGLYDQLISMA